MKNIVLIVSAIVITTGCTGMHYTTRTVERVDTDPETGSVVKTKEEGPLMETARDLRERQEAEARAEALRNGKIKNTQQERCEDGDCVRTATGAASVVQAAGNNGMYGLGGIGGFGGMYGLGGLDAGDNFAIMREQTVQAQSANRANLAGQPVAGGQAQSAPAQAQAAPAPAFPGMAPTSAQQPMAAASSEELKAMKKDLEELKQGNTLRDKQLQEIKDENQIILQGTMGGQE